MNKKQRRERSHLRRTINEVTRLHTLQRGHALDKHGDCIKLESELRSQRRENRDWLIELLPVGLRWLARWRFLHRALTPEVILSDQRKQAHLKLMS